MNVIFCSPELTMKNTKDGLAFWEECRMMLEQYLMNTKYIKSDYLVRQALVGRADKDDIFIFFTSEDGIYEERVLRLIQMYAEVRSRIWPVAMEANPECRCPPAPVSDKQSFDVSCRKENRNPLKNNMRAIAQIFVRKIIAQTLSPLYRDEVLYFISHRRIDGEKLAAKLADELRLLTRERNVYRDVVNVAVGDDAQEDIDANLQVSDVLIFLQTQQAQYSKYIMKELCYALVNDIPVLWIQIDDASYDDMEIRPGENPILKYQSEEFYIPDRLAEIAEEVEEKCFQLIMSSSSQVYSYVEYLTEMKNKKKIRMESVEGRTLAYEVEYQKKKSIFDDGLRKHYIQCFGRNPRKQDIIHFIDDVKNKDIYQRNDRLFVLSNHGHKSKQTDDGKVWGQNFEDYIASLSYVVGEPINRRNKRIIISGAFPDYDEIYKHSLMEAVVIYAKQIIKNGYRLVFGAHPTFQNLIFDIGDLYSDDVKYSIEMHMDRAYVGQYDMEELQKRCTLILSDGLAEMRENMICKEEAEMLICLGGKIKENKAEQGVDIEVELAKKSGIPVALVGTVGGRSSEYAFEILKKGNWSELNPWSTELNEGLFYNVNHRLMAEKVLNIV